MSRARRLLATAVRPRRAAAALERELAVYRGVRLAERALARAAANGERVLVGPFLGEVGYELLYWVPFVRRTLAAHGIPAGQVTTLTRGGAGVWYADLAASHVDLLELLDPGAFVEGVLARRQRAGDAKQLRDDPFDRLLAARARERIGPAVDLHPSLMFARLRGLWFRDEPLESALARLDVRRLEPPPRPAGLPAEYLAAKLYFSDCYPDEQEVRERTRALLRRLAARMPVVLLSAGTMLDEHREWEGKGGLVRLEGIRPEDNLAVQTAVLGGAGGLVSTYGGFSYLGPLLGVPTLALHERAAFLPQHLELARRLFAETPYTVGPLGDEDAVERFLAEALAPAGSRA